MEAIVEIWLLWGTSNLFLGWGLIYTAIQFSKCHKFIEQEGLLNKYNKEYKNIDIKWRLRKWL